MPGQNAPEGTPSVVGWHVGQRPEHSRGDCVLPALLRCVDRTEQADLVAGDGLEHRADRKEEMW